MASFGQNPQPRNPRRTLLRGLVWLAIGLGLAAAIALQEDWRKAAFALIPAGIALAHLIYHAVEGKNEIADMKRKAK